MFNTILVALYSKYKNYLKDSKTIFPPTPGMPWNNLFTYEFLEYFYLMSLFLSLLYLFRRSNFFICIEMEREHKKDHMSGTGLWQSLDKSTNTVVILEPRITMFAK